MYTDSVEMMKIVFSTIQIFIFERDRSRYPGPQIRVSASLKNPPFRKYRKADSCLFVLGQHAVDDGHKDIHHMGIELGPSAPLQLPDHIVRAAFLPVDTAGIHGVEAVCHAGDPGLQGDLFSLKALGITPSVIPLVMVQHHVQDQIAFDTGLQDVVADLGMGLDHPIFLICQTAVLL